LSAQPLEEGMLIAAITFVFNESINLPIWLRHYGASVGEENLFIVDHGSNDGSVDQVGMANVIRLPKREFDEVNRVGFIRKFHESLLKFYDAVIYTDCDEMLIADPAVYRNLRHYLESMAVDYVNALGVDVVHMIQLEPPMNLARPILAQRRFGRFQSGLCKALIARSPVAWIPGFHCCDKPPIFDRNLFMFHLKLMDFNIALNRHKLNSENNWSQRAIDSRHGAHHRYDQQIFVQQFFLDPINLYSRNQVGDFEFERELEKIKAQTVVHDGIHHLPMDVSKLVAIPERFSQCI